MSEDVRERLETSQGSHSGSDCPDGAPLQDQSSPPDGGKSFPFFTSFISPDSSELFKPLAEKIIASTAGQIASTVLPDIPWVEVYVLHIFRVIMRQLGRHIEDVTAAEVPNIADQIYVHPLHAAASTGHVDASLCSRLILNENVNQVEDPRVEGFSTCGFNCNELDGYGKSALHWASSAGLDDWVSTLLHSGADPNIVDGRGLTALYEAVAGSYDSTVRLLLKYGADLNYQECMRGRSPLHMAAMFGTPELVKILCDAGARHDLRDKLDGFTPLMSAVAKNKLRATEVLLEHGTDPETESVMILTPLMVASISGYVDIATALLRRGANPRHAGIGNLTPLHLASEKGHADLVELLLREGADPKARVANPAPRSTPLHLACRSARLASVIALLRGGSDETIHDETPAPPAAPKSGSACPHSTPFDVIGFGIFSTDEDPTVRDNSEDEVEYQRRRDPETLERIREVLRRAPADRAWRRRSWIVMLRSVSSRRGGNDCVASEDNRAEERAVRGEEGGSCKDVWADGPPGQGLKRARHEGDAQEVVDLHVNGRSTKAKTNGADLICTLGAGEVVLGTGRNSYRAEFSGDGGSSRETESFRPLFGRVFDLADVEEGAFRRIVSFL